MRPRHALPFEGPYRHHRGLHRVGRVLGNRAALLLSHPVVKGIGWLLAGSALFAACIVIGYGLAGIGG